METSTYVASEQNGVMVGSISSHGHDVTEFQPSMWYLYENWLPRVKMGRQTGPYEVLGEFGKKYRRSSIRKHLRRSGECPVCKAKELKLNLAACKADLIGGACLECRLGLPCTF